MKKFKVGLPKFGFPDVVIEAADAKAAAEEYRKRFRLAAHVHPVVTLVE